jgi:hypothetical protein
MRAQGRAPWLSRLVVTVLAVAFLSLSAAAALGAVAFSASHTAASLPGTWSGTVTVAANLSGDYQTTLVPPSPPWSAVIHVERQESSTYTLAGAATSEGLVPGQMVGSASGTETPLSVSPSNACFRTLDPAYAWSYQGPAQVQITYANGAFVLRPQAVAVTATTLNHGCGVPDSQVQAQLTVPGGRLGTPALVASQHAPANATSLAGSTSIPWVFGPSPLGNMTITWDLTRKGATQPTPTGTATGTVLVNNQPYTSGQPIPYGSKVGVTHGRLTLNTEVGTLTVYGGGVSAIFRLLRLTEQGKTLVELRLVEGDFFVCKSAFRTTSAASLPRKTVRRLWATGKGRFRTRGRYSAATVRGTFWLTADRCDGTLTQVKQGKVAVSDFVKHKTVLVPAGKSYLATPK